MLCFHAAVVERVGDLQNFFETCSTLTNTSLSLMRKPEILKIDSRKLERKLKGEIGTVEYRNGYNMILNLRFVSSL